MPADRAIDKCPACFGPHPFILCPSRDAVGPVMRALLDIAIAAESWQVRNANVDLVDAGQLALWDATARWRKEAGRA